MSNTKEVEKQAVSAIRMLAVDMVEQAKSGHPGMPLGAASLAYVLFHRFMRHNPANPRWAGRDRFVLSPGHGSALLYAMLHLTGYDLPLEELKNFRQWESKTPGHPEYGHTPGVEATTGPLGHGFAMGVGMALAERFLAAQFNRPGHEIIDHFTYAIVSDGDLMEGVSCEAASLAGTLGLGKLIYLYDDNKITIEGSTDLAFSENVGQRFAAYGWQVIEVSDGDDLEALSQAVEQAKADAARPSLVICRTHIGCGSPKADSASAHGEPLGAEALSATRECYLWPQEPFHIPAAAQEHLRASLAQGRAQEDQWQEQLAAYATAHPELAKTLGAQLNGMLPQGWQDALPRFDKAMATREASGLVLNALAQVIPNLVGGSADLAPSNKTWIKNSPDMRGTGENCGRNIHFGVREQAMGAIVNGMALHGGVIPYAGTFFVFSDFMRPALRLAALMGAHAIFVFTHDSVAVGEDGPTHQPIEQLMSLRLMPGLTILRPADPNETSAAWATALTAPGPVCLVLTRQKLNALAPAGVDLAQGLAKGAYVLSDCPGTPQLLILATGSEVQLALAAQAKLAEQAIPARVVSMPSWELFAAQDQAYQDQVLPPSVTKRLSIEAGATLGWQRWLGNQGVAIGIDRFGASAPGDQAMHKLGMNLDNVLAQALELLGR